MGEGKKTRDHGNEIMKNDIALDSFKEVSDVFPFPASMPFFPSIENYMATFRWHDSRCQGFFVYQWCPLLTQCLWKKKNKPDYRWLLMLSPREGRSGLGRGSWHFLSKNSNSPAPRQNNWSKSPRGGKWSRSNVLQTLITYGQNPYPGDRPHD